ncbi:isopeptide-forming domain-containing fimbrial protein [Auritidibacter ignavus]|uniref:isopeptide-forming domain-containing fimbrial protein n=1 Tax=Auritidibacter ignavus TaxID=678932 RepID=UPI002447F3AB|nr:isopeptide-forming domain-containing fimbrial protein [Auritidibacter ignavus]WGH83137.1 isopeptide-forming domain-containing fimbrial protein [Auritidibacter ignavus]
MPIRLRLRFSAIFLTALALVAGLVLPSALPAEAETGQTKAYEFTGNWIDQPEALESGVGVVGAQWRLDINDSAAAPGNANVDGNVLEVTLENAVFTDTPETCESAELSEDRRSVTCDLGERAQGTAEVAFTGVLADGPAGSFVTATGTFRGHEVKLPEIPIIKNFGMTAKFDGGHPQSLIATNTRYQNINFPFSISHAQQTANGPDSVTYRLDIRYVDQNGRMVATVDPRQTSCSANDRIQSGYPFSDGQHAENQSTHFPDCTLRKTGDTTFELTLSDLNYDNGPRLDSNGQPLPVGWDVIAAGNIHLQVPYNQQARGGTVRLKAEPQTYTSVEGETYEDTLDNKTNAIPVVRGAFTGGWVLGAQRPNAYPGSPWTNTYRVPAGATVTSVAATTPTTSQNSKAHNWVCTTFDTEYVEFQDARVSLKREAQPTYIYDDSYEGDIWYYTGDMVDAWTGEPVDPNFFNCGTEAKRSDPAHGNPPGWSTEKPDDLSTVKAVKVELRPELLAETTHERSVVYLVSELKLKPSAKPGQDVYTWAYSLEQGRNEWRADRIQNNLDYYDRSMNPDLAEPHNTLTPEGWRYPYSGPGRDALLVVGSFPLVENLIENTEYKPGDAAKYTVRYGLESNLAEPDTDQVVVKNTLAKGMEYVPGTAQARTGAAVGEPEVSTNDDGQQVLTWTIDNVLPNDELGEIVFEATVPDDAEPGAVFVNKATATSQEVTVDDSVQFVVPRSGHTSIVKDTEQATLDLPKADDPDQDVTAWWDVKVTSEDPNTSSFVDVIDSLPYDGDGRGTSTDAQLKLASVDAPQGATVYYTTVDPAELDEDPGAEVNGGAGTPSDIWSTEFTEDATAVRVITGELAPGKTLSFRVNLSVIGGKNGDILVNKAVGRAESTQLRMRTSSPVTFIGAEEPSPSPSEPTEPSPSEPSPTEPTPTEPSEPSPSEPSPTEPSPTEPSPTEPSPTEPSPTEPSPSEPTPSEPSPTEPSEPSPSESSPSEPTEPSPSEPTPSEPSPSETQPGSSEPSSPEPSGSASTPTSTPEEPGVTESSTAGQPGATPDQPSDREDDDLASTGSAVLAMAMAAAALIGLGLVLTVARRKRHG